MNVNLVASIPVAHVEDKKNNTGVYGLGVIVGAVMIPAEEGIQLKYLVQWEAKQNPAIFDHFANELLNLTDFEGVAEDFFGGNLEGGEEDGEEEGFELEEVGAAGAQLEASDLDDLEEEVLGAEEYVGDNEEYVNTEVVETTALDMTNHAPAKRASEVTM
jgi:hypothetical protein